MAGAGREAMLRSDWAGAEEWFRQALTEQDSAEAHHGLGQALWFQGELRAAIAHHGLAYERYREARDPSAARVACWIAMEQLALNGDLSAAREWLERAASSVDPAEPSSGLGWFLLTRSALGPAAGPALGPAVGMESAREGAQAAIELARSLGDRDLEACALAVAGRALVDEGRIDAGMALLSTAMGAVSGGEVTDATAVADVFCLALEAAELAREFTLASVWVRDVARWYGESRCPFVAGKCRTTWASVLIAQGRWPEPEAQLVAAIRLYERGHRGLSAHALARLAERGFRRGALDEAEEILGQLEGRPESLFPSALLQLRRGQAATALVLLERILPRGPLTLGALPAVELAIDALLATGRAERAGEWAAKLSALAAGSGSRVLEAEAKLAEGRVAAAVGDLDGAAFLLSEAARLRPEAGTPLAARIQLELGRVLAAGDASGAILRAQAALAGFHRLGLPWEARQAAELLGSLGRGAGSPGAVGTAGSAPSVPAGVRLPDDPAVLTDVLAALEHGVTG